MKYVFILAMAFLFYSCTKHESNILPESVTSEQVVPVQMNNPSPCNSTLTDNQVECSPNIFPNSIVTVTSILSNSKEIDGSAGGDIDVRFGDSIAPGVYKLVDSSTPETGEASMSITPIFCSICPYKATSGSLYVTETSTQWVVEWCSVNFNSITITPNSTVSGRIITNK